MNSRTRILLDTNIVIHRETPRVVREDIGKVFRWMDRLGYQKCVHPFTIAEIERHANRDVVDSFKAKILSYEVLQSVARDTEELAKVRVNDKTDNDRIDTSILAELAAHRVDLVLTEDRGIHRKAEQLGLAHLVLTIDTFLEKVTTENPEQSDYQVLSVHRTLFGEIDVRDPFFDSFRSDYHDFDKWFARKAEEKAYVCFSGEGRVVAFLYLKHERPGSEDYSDLSPPLSRAHRLKIGTLKVAANGVKLGERFLKIVFDQAVRLRVDEIYVTLFRHSAAHDRLAEQLQDWGFRVHGTKQSASGVEQVLIRPFLPRANRENPRSTFPFISKAARKFIVPIYPEYHTELLPDSILRTETPARYVDDKPHRNALSKVYISRSIERRLNSGDAIVFYRTQSGGPAHYTSVATTIGIVENVVDRIPSLEHFIALCRKRSVFTDAQLADYWNFRPANRPFIVNFLYAYSLPSRPNLRALRDSGVLMDAPRGFEELSDDAFTTLLRISSANASLIVD